MPEDLISNNFVDNVNRSVIKKTFTITKSILILVIIYAVLELLYWYIAVSNSIGHVFKYAYIFYEYRILPIIAFINLSIGITSWSYIVKANKTIASAFEKADADFFNAGYQFYFKSARLTLVSVCISVLSICTRLLLKYLYDY
jgi:hypothetical protein